jgi:hypothetical protein
LLGSPQNQVESNSRSALLARVGKIKPVLHLITQGITMSSHTPDSKAQASDPVEDVVSSMPLVLPLVGAVLMFLLAFIAVSMA